MNGEVAKHPYIFLLSVSSLRRFCPSIWEHENSSRGEIFQYGHLFQWQCSKRDFSCFGEKFFSLPVEFWNKKWNEISLEINKQQETKLTRILTLFFFFFYQTPKIPSKTKKIFSLAWACEILHTVTSVKYIMYIISIESDII